MPTRIPGDSDPDRKWQAARDDAHTDGYAVERQEFDLEAYELSESDDMERFAARRRFLEETERPFAL